MFILTFYVDNNHGLGNDESPNIFEVHRSSRVKEEINGGESRRCGSYYHCNDRFDVVETIEI